MAITEALRCPKCETGHCWHVVYVASSYQIGQHDSTGQRCCWCGENSPLTVSYCAPVKHGEHAPLAPFTTPFRT